MIFLRCVWLRVRLGVVLLATQYFWHLALLLTGCHGIAIQTFKALVATQLGTLLWLTPESRSVLIHVLRTEWLVNLVNLPLVDIGKFIVALVRNLPILFFPIRLLINQIWSSGFVGDEQLGRMGFLVIWLPLVSSKQNIWSKTLDIFCYLFRTLLGGKSCCVCFRRRGGSCFPSPLSTPGILHH